MDTKVDLYFNKTQQWQDELRQLRKLPLDCGLNEVLKWRNPCYTFKTNNIALIGAFKTYCALSFFKGVLLQDANGILHKPGENSQTVRLIKFTNLKEIIALQPIIKAYIYEAIEVEKAGLKVEFKESTNLLLAEELEIQFHKNPTFKTAFAALTPGRQRAYNMYFSAPKQAKTRATRVEKYIQQILNGQGLNDCTCGLSQKLPYCDGSHKYL
jgi:uncharacterized protein YdeI (YjbR/CyaY-like superfamily)